VLILMTALFIHTPLEFSSFPTVLLALTPQSCAADFIDGRHDHYSAARLPRIHNLEYTGR
jgi:hypothetical protein